MDCKNCEIYKEAIENTKNDIGRIDSETLLNDLIYVIEKEITCEHEWDGHECVKCGEVSYAHTCGSPYCRCGS